MLLADRFGPDPVGPRWRGPERLAELVRFLPLQIPTEHSAAVDRPRPVCERPCRLRDQVGFRRACAATRKAHPSPGDEAPSPRWEGLFESPETPIRRRSGSAAVPELRRPHLRARLAPERALDETDADEFGAFVSRALSFQTNQIEAKRRAAQIWHTYAEELRAAQRALEQAIENEQSAERASERAEEDSPAEGKAEHAVRDARDDQVNAAKDAAEAAERASQAMEGVIGGLAAVPAPPAPPAGAIPPGGRLKVPDPGESLVDRLFGRDYIYPEEAPEFLEMGGGGALFRALGRVLVGAGKAGPRRTRLTPGGGLKAHEGAGRGHTLTRHVGQTDDQLRARLAQERNLPRASTFENRPSPRTPSRGP